MNTLVACPSTGSFGQQVALAFHERKALATLLTLFAYNDRGMIAKLLLLAPTALRTAVDLQLRRREISMIPREKIEDKPFWEVVRTVADKLGAGAPMLDRIWDHLSHSFASTATKLVARDEIKAIYAYEYVALESFEAAGRLGVAKILDYPSLNSRRYEELQRREKEAFPELRCRQDGYFNAKFERRQARRSAEMALADVIITNSSLTRLSHIAGGADPQKTFAVPLGAPVPRQDFEARPPSQAPLRVVWAGKFSLLKGAHYLLQSWRRLTATHKTAAVADIYGVIALPEQFRMRSPEGMRFHGSVVRSRLFEAFDSADVLVFPTLADGFGMVVTEAFARGLPVITTDQAGASDLVEHRKNGLIIPAGDQDALTEALYWCLDHREALAEMRQAAYDTAKRWQWSDYRRALIDAVTTGLRRAGYTPSFDEPEVMDGDARLV